MKQNQGNSAPLVAGTVLHGDSPAWRFCEYGGDGAWRRRMQATVTKAISDRTADAIVTRVETGEDCLKVGMILRLRRNNRGVWTYVYRHPESHRLGTAGKDVLHMSSGRAFSGLEMRVVEEAAILKEFEKVRQLLKEKKPTKALRLCNEYIRVRTESKDAILATLKI